MRSKFTWIFTLLFVFFVQIGFAQQKQVSGVVKTDSGDPIPGATVMLVGTNQGADTDLEGKYTLNVKKGDKIRVAFLGYKTTVVTVSDSNVLNITLVEEDISEELTGVVIDTYRTTSKAENANAVSTVTSKTIEGRPNASFIQTLQGQVPGLNISTGSGQPGDNNTTVILRGVGSINGNIEPLYVIDGIPMSSDRFRSLNPNDIENISVLKDAGATSIYGNRGANGVIVITTKGGSFDTSLAIKYVGTSGVSTIQNNNYNLMNAREYMEFSNQAKTDYPGLQFSKFGANAIRNAKDANWLDVFFNDAMSQTHTLTFTGGSKNLASYTSVGYADYEGILKSTGLKRFNFRSNLNGKNNSGRLTYGTTVSGNYSKSDMITGTGTNGINQNFFLGAFQSMPHLDPTLYKGSYESINDILNNAVNSAAAMPYLLLDKRRTSGYTQNELKLLFNGNLSYKLTDHLVVSNQTGVDYQSINQNQWEAPDAFNSRYFAAPGQEYFGYVSEIVEDRMIFNSNTNLKYSNTWNDVHKFSAGAYLEYIKAHYKSRSIAKEGFDPVFWSPGGSTGWIGSAVDRVLYAPTGGISIQNAGLFSYFANASYDYDMRYGVDATIRRDASFRFTDDNRWGTFWSVSARWNISNEKFMEDSAFSNLKLRGSYGTAGNQDILGTGIFGAAQLYNTLYASGTGYNKLNSLYISNLPNPSLQWEVVTQANIGLDFGLWNERLRGSLDVYRKQTDDLYQTRWVSAINGATSLPANFGTLRNEGVELNIAGDIIRNANTRLTLNVNGAYNKNTVVEIPSEEGYFWDGSSLTGLKEGGMVNQFYMHEFAGINPENGNMLFYAANGGTTEAPGDADLRWLGKSAIPIYQGGFGLDFEHKGFFVTANFTYALDVWRYDNDYYFFTAPTFIGQNNITKDMVNNYWTPSNRDADFPKLVGSNFAYATGTSFYLQDASYLRLRYLSVGYNFKKKDLDFVKLSGLRVYAQGENLHTWSKWRGWDAESNRGVDFGQYPTPKTFSFGVEVSF